MKLLGRKEVDRKLGVEPSGQGTGRERGNKGKKQGEKGHKNRGRTEGLGKGKRGMKEGAWGRWRTEG